MEREGRREESEGQGLVTGGVSSRDEKLPREGLGWGPGG